MTYMILFFLYWKASALFITAGASAKDSLVIERVNQRNLKEVHDFLSVHEETAQFLINNLKSFGSNLTDHYNSGNFKLIRTNGDIAGVFCLTRRGDLLIQSDISEPKVVLQACSDEPIPLNGFVGEWDSVEPVYDLFRTQNPEYQPTYESKEILYSYSLEQSDHRLKYDSRVRFLNAEDLPQWLELNNAYLEELSLPNELTVEQKKKSFEIQVLEKTLWGLFENENLLSQTALNSKSENIGQVGGVFTLRAYRRHGLSKATMFHMLKDCRDTHGHKKNILFTGQTDIPAQKLYESMGYQRIGFFALILGLQ